MNKKSKTAQLDDKLKNLLLLAYSGDKIAYTEFLKICSDLLTRYMHSNRLAKFYDAALKEEFVQDILLLIHRKRSSYRTDMPVTPWIYAIAKHYLIDQLRKKKITIEESELVEEFSDHSHVTYDDQLDHEQQVENLLAKLSDQQKQILLLAKAHDFTSKEIAQQLGLTTSAVKVSIHRSLKFIRNLYRKPD